MHSTLVGAIKPLVGGTTFVLILAMSLALIFWGKKKKKKSMGLDTLGSFFVFFCPFIQKGQFCNFPLADLQSKPCLKRGLL